KSGAPSACASAHGAKARTQRGPVIAALSCPTFTTNFPSCARRLPEARYHGEIINGQRQARYPVHLAKAAGLADNLAKVHHDGTNAAPGECQVGGPWGLH